ncbi:MAG: DEAD/DEAH box helicase [Deltaproteobacteria bacterium]|nr:DEAD/DEAH box helicase [Deltaproteobacteria bacterium]
MTLTEFIGELKKRKDLREFVHHEIIPPVTASFAGTEKPLRPELEKALKGYGIEKLYAHQARAIDLVRQGKNVVVMTPTSSGKSLVYNIPVIEGILGDPHSRALYLFPLKGLEHDQLKALTEISGKIPLENACAIYDGDTAGRMREKIRASPPSVVFTNPDMLHLAICAFHGKWEVFLRNLRYVIIDEIHSYRGVVGSHVAQVLRRLRRIAGSYGSNPVFIASSATIANPQELTATLTGLPFELVATSGAPQGKRNFLFLDPAPEVSPYSAATRLFTESVRAGFRTIAFTKARKITELMHAWTEKDAPDIKNSISSYRAGFLPAERREIEARLFSGELKGVISTSALELGVDIGGLDVCILAGYPGTISSTWQRSGRVGRGGRDSLIIMVAIEDALDRYFMRHPQEFFGRNAEAAVADVANPLILKSHLQCAASELPVAADDGVYDMAVATPVLDELAGEGKLWRSKVKNTWNPRARYPHRNVSIRGTGAPYRIVSEDRKPIAEGDSSRVLRELHPGAIYMHRGSQHLVLSLNMADREVVCRRVDVNYHTSPITDEDTEIISVEAKKRVENFDVTIGTLRITESVLGYRKKELYTRRIIDERTLTLPPHVFTTTGIWMEVQETILDKVRALGYGAAGGLHALEHSAIAALPLYAMCDRMDLGGVSYTMSPQLEAPAIFIYDGYEGGIGLTRRGYGVIKDWFASTLKLMEDCPCEVSCPSCTQDPKCGNNNEPLDKRAAILILRQWLAGKPGIVHRGRTKFVALP